MTTENLQPESDSPRSRPGPLTRLARARIGRVRVAGLISAVAIVALLGAAYQIGSPSSGSEQTPIPPGDVRFAGEGAGPVVGPAMPAPSAAPTAGPAAVDGSVDLNSQSGGKSISYDQTSTGEQTQIVKTGSMSIEVGDLDKAVANARSAITGLGGYVSDSTQSGDKDSAVATVTFRLPVARWDEALAAMRGLSTRLINEQTNSSDVTMQVVDLDARLKNLQATESALQAIMARATAIPDVLAVQEQLTQTRGQIEELTAQRDHLKDQAAMSTLAVTFQTPTTVTIQATHDWSLGNQVDEAVAALVRLGQGLATMAVWAVIVGVPIVIGVLILGLFLWILRRIARRHPRQPAGAQG